MADDKDLRGRQDRSRVAGDEDYEVQYLANKLGVSEEEVRTAIHAVGNDRKKVEAYLKQEGGR